MVRPRVVHELVDDGVDLFDIGGHMFASGQVRNAEFGFQPKPCQGSTQIVRNAGQHDGAVLLDLCQLSRHAVEFDIHFADLAGGRRFIEFTAREIAVAYTPRSDRQLPQGTIEQPCKQGSPRQGQSGSRYEPDDPCFADRRIKP